MNPAAKGAYYARLFRKAGTYLGKGKRARAIVVLEEGRDFAAREGDRAMAKRFAEEIVRVSLPPADSSE